MAIKSVDDMGWYEVADVRSDVRQIEKMLAQGQLDPERNPAFQASFVLAIIYLNDVLAKASACDRRIAFDDDVLKTDTICDVTGLVRELRNALTHVPSHQRRVGRVKANFGLMGARGRIEYPDRVMENPYNDDVAVFVGPMRIFLRRHIERAVAEARAFADSLPDLDDL